MERYNGWIKEGKIPASSKVITIRESLSGHRLHITGQATMPNDLALLQKNMKKLVAKQKNEKVKHIADILANKSKSTRADEKEEIRNLVPLIQPKENAT